MDTSLSRKTNLLLLFLLLITSCSNGSPTITGPGEPQEPTTTIVATESSTPDPALSPTPQPFPTPITLGPDEFPEGYNPLTGQRVSDPAQLTYPALLLSVSHFPPAAPHRQGFLSHRLFMSITLPKVPHDISGCSMANSLHRKSHYMVIAKFAPSR
jgi:hypothetical protein